MGRILISCIILIIYAAQASPQSVATEKDDCAEIKATAARLEARIKNWPALSRYREANAKVPLPAKHEQRVVFMGDSITDWWVKQESGGFFPGKQYINRGIAGQTTQQMLVRFRSDVIALKPKVVVILAGTNDLAFVTAPNALQAIENNLTSMIELARVNRIRVVLASLLPVSDYGKEKDGKPVIQTTSRPPEQIKALNDWMKAYAAENGLTYLNYHSAMVDGKGFLRDELSNDGLHPNDRGYAVMAPIAERAIAAAFKWKR